MIHESWMEIDKERNLHDERKRDERPHNAAQEMTKVLLGVPIG